MKTKTLEYLTAVIATIVLMLRRFFFGWIGVDTKIGHVLANQESMRNELDEIFERFVELESQHRLLMEKKLPCFCDSPHGGQKSREYKVQPLTDHDDV